MRMNKTSNVGYMKYQPLNWGTRAFLFVAVIAPVALVFVVLGILKFIAGH